MAVDLTTLRKDIQDYIYFRLAGDMVDVELDPSHYDMCINQSMRKYRQKAQASVESSYVFLPIVAEQQEYILPDEIQEVRQVFRRSIGSGSDSGTQFEPFEAAFVNTYLLQAGRVGGQATYEMYFQYQELSARMFGGFINFDWDRVNHKITLLRKFDGTGEVDSVTFGISGFFGSELKILPLLTGSGSGSAVTDSGTEGARLAML